MDFTELGLAEPLQRATAALGYQQATPIQSQAIPLILAGRDLVGCAQTGTGKTAAFALPLLDRLMQSLPPRPAPRPATDATDGADRPRGKGAKGGTPRPRALRALILAPTRELASQIGASFQKYGRHTPLRTATIFGGVSQVPQVKALRHGVDILAATPGRLLDLIEQGHIDLSQVETAVLDEADQMLDMGFLPDLKRIIGKLPARRQTLMFSATMPTAIRRLADQWLSHPASVAATPIAAPAERVEQAVHMVEKQHKAAHLLKFLQETPNCRTLVFSRTKHGADKIVRALTRAGLRAAAIHGNKSQNTRTRTLEQFKGRNPPVLVATDIAARGLDIREVSHIVNYDLPETPETYVHRIGRTARAGAAGVAISFCASDERKLLRDIERLMKRRIEVTLGEAIEHDLEAKPESPSQRPRGKAKTGGRRVRRGRAGATDVRHPAAASSGQQQSGRRRTNAVSRPKSSKPRRRVAV